MNRWVREDQVTSQFSLIIQKSNIQVTVAPSSEFPEHSVISHGSHHTLPRVFPHSVHPLDRKDGSLSPSTQHLLLCPFLCLLLTSWLTYVLSVFPGHLGKLPSWHSLHYAHVLSQKSGSSSRWTSCLIPFGVPIAWQRTQQVNDESEWLVNICTRCLTALLGYNPRTLKFYHAKCAVW